MRWLGVGFALLLGLLLASRWRRSRRKATP